jgi:hypothetical protein
MHPSLDEKRVAEMSSEGEASAATEFEYHERDGLVGRGTRAALFGSGSWSGRGMATDLSSATAS